jgi:nitrite reductase/ring-hydroxylating ferredoxin subunit
MAQSSRRIFLLFSGVLLFGAIAQKTEFLKKSEPAPTPKLTPTPKPTPTPNLTSPSATATKTKAVQSPPPQPIEKTTSPTPAASPVETSTPQATQTSTLEGVVIAKSDDLNLRQTKVFKLKDSFGITTSYSLTRTSNGIVAFDTRCTHKQAPCVLSDSLLRCPAHGSVFDPESGEVVLGPAVEPLKSYRTIEIDGEIRIVIL